MKRKLLEQAKVVPAISPQASVGAGAVNGNVIDTSYFDSAVVSIGVGAVSGTPTSYTVDAKLQHGSASDGSDMADVAGCTMTTLTADNTNTYKSFDIVGLKQYIRVVFTVAFVGGTTPKQFITGSIALGDNNVEPV